jgi:hypothetical protein
VGVGKGVVDIVGDIVTRVFLDLGCSRVIVLRMCVVSGEVDVIVTDQELLMLSSSLIELVVVAVLLEMFVVI